MKIFERIPKRPTLRNYYRNRAFRWPDTLPEIFDYLQRHDELPFRYEGDNWPYDAMCERQRRKGVHASQFLTPDRTARQMAALAVRYFDNENRIVDACCGTGQLSRALKAEGVHPSQFVAFDADGEMTDIYARLYPEAAVMRAHLREVDFRCGNVVANPPFGIAECTEFLHWLGDVQCSEDKSVLLLPAGFIDKPRPKTIQNLMQRFCICYRTSMREAFARTTARAEIVVLERRQRREKRPGEYRREGCRTENPAIRHAAKNRNVSRRSGNLKIIKTKIKLTSALFGSVADPIGKKGERLRSGRALTRRPRLWMPGHSPAAVRRTTARRRNRPRRR